MEKDDLRLLFLAPFAPRLDAPHGGGRVLAQYLSRLCRRHQVALLCLSAPGDPPLDEFFTRHCDLRVEEHRPWAGSAPRQQLARAVRLLAALARRRPLWVADWESLRFARIVRETVQAWQPDIIQIEYHVMAQYLPCLQGSPAPRILTEYEPGVLAAPYLKAGPAALVRLVQRFDQAAWARFEPDAIRQVQAVVAFTAKDQAVLESFGLPTPIARIPFGLEIPERPLSFLGSSPTTLLFYGNYLHPPNVEAALRLVAHIFPALQKEFPQLRLTIAGPHPPPRLTRYAGEQVAITGWLPDLTPCLDQAAVFIAPLYSGGGMRVKILEALACGKAVVCTPLAAEGLALANGAEVLFGRNDGEIIEQTRRLLANPDQRAAQARRAREWACQNLGWDEPVRAYEQIYQDLLRRKSIKRASQA